MSLSAPGQFDRARERGTRARWTPRRPRTRVALVSFARRWRQWSSSRRPIARRSRAAIAQAVGRRRRHALSHRAARASARSLGARDGRVVIVTDLQQSGWEANDDGGLPDGVDIEVIEHRAADRQPGAHLSGACAIDAWSRRSRTSAIAKRGRPSSSSPGGKARSPRSEVTIGAAGGVGRRADRHVAAHRRRRGPHRRCRLAISSITRASCPLDPQTAVPIAVIVADPTGSTGGLYLERALNVAGGGREFRRRCSRWTRGGEVGAGRPEAPGGGVRARHAHARPRRPRPAEDLHRWRRPGVCGPGARC